jgi:p-cumate 2,3-dioxygenase subunit alpha
VPGPKADTSETMLNLNLKTGPVADRECYTSDAIFCKETELIFERSWLFVAHQSELKTVGDFVTTDLAGQPVLAICGDDGQIRVFLNTCLHRGAIVETERTGCRKRFQCLYHHWEYDAQGQLVFVPREDGFGPDFKRATHGLVPLPKLEIFNGLVFASLSGDVPPFLDYLGDAVPFLEEFSTYDGRPLDVVGSFEFTYQGNWKLLYENTFDDYHNEYLHARAYQNVPGLQYGKSFLKSRKENAPQANAPQPSAGGKRARNETHAPTKAGMHSVLHWDDAADKMVFQKERTHRINIGIFPSFLGVFNPVLDFTSFRMLKPENPSLTRVLNYCLAPADLPANEKKVVASRFGGAFGPGGPIMMDDIRALALVQKGLKAKAGNVLHSRGLHQRPGSVGSDSDDHAIRSLWETWRHCMASEQVAHDAH